MNNDFKNSYKNEMDKVMPSAESIEKLTDAMTEKKARRISPVFVRRIAAVAASLAILIAAIPIGLSMRGDSLEGLSPMDLITPSPSVDKVTMANYDEIYEKISAAVKEYGSRYHIYRGDDADGFDLLVDEVLTGGLETMASTAVTPIPGVSVQTKYDYLYTNTEEAETPEFSDTNLQVAGVNEADIIKTDGKYIYALSEKYLHIVEAVDGKLTLISKISRKASDDTNSPNTIQEMYINGDKLIVVGSIWEKVEKTVEYEIEEENKNSAKAKEIIGAAVSVDTWDKGGVVAVVPHTSYNYVGYGIEIYDISDRTTPKLVNTISQDGSYVSSRMIGDVLYLITNKVIYDNISISEPSTFIPIVDGSLIAPDCIYIAKNAEEITSSQYLVVSGIDTTGEGAVVSTKSLFGFGSNVYCSPSNLYVTAYTSQNNDNVRSNATKIFKFSLDAGKVDFVSEGTVPGTVLNQFSLDEKDGYLRMVTTFQSWKMEEVQNGEYTYISQTEHKKSNCLYVLDSDLTVVGKLEDLAPGEQIYSARFDGDIAYFVTFRQTDPLFTVDLSSPTAPKILSELKIPGFSEYLHPWSEDLLFGFGKYANEITGRAGDLKLAMFDVSDKSDVSEAHTLTLTGNSYSSASYNHKAILINAAKNIIAFPTDSSKYLVYSYDEEKGFEQMAEIHISGKLDYYKYYGEMRGLFIGDYLYVYSPVGIASYNMNDYTFKASVNLD